MKWKGGKMSGKLEVIAGCMFSGKTEELLRRIERAKIAKRKVLLLKPEIDTRYSKEEVVTHYGRSYPCRRIPLDITLETLKEALGSELDEAEVVGFDEAHFFAPTFVEVCTSLADQGKRVIVAGLDLDFRGEPFGCMPQLLALADEVLKLTAICVKCGKPATRTQRLINGKPAPRKAPVVVVGGLDIYEARCRDCWEAPK